MNYELHNLREKLGLIGELIDGWETIGANELERDLALELLRGIYSELKFGTEETVVTDAETVDVTDGMIAADESTIIDETALEGEDCQMPEPEHEPGQEPTTTSQDGDQEPEPEPESEPEPTIIPRRVDPKVIRSLYGTDGDDEEPEAAACPIVAESPADEEAPQSDEVVLTDESTETTTPSATHAAPPHPATLGDSLKAGQKTLGESLREGNGEKDMASHIAAAERPDLKKSIGLNDRFLMIRDLFDGNASAFDEAITRLDAFTDLDSAVIHIHDTYDWNADSQGAKRLVELLERKLA